MSQSPVERWLAANQAMLAAALAVEQAELLRYTGQPIPEEERRGEALQRAMQALPEPSTLERLQALFGLSLFETRLLLWCAGAELDAAFCDSLAAAQGSQALRRPTFSLALAVIAERHWSALSPSGALRYWRMIEIQPGAALTAAALRIDERILHHLLGVQQVDDRLTAFVQPVDAPQWVSPGQAEQAARLAALWQQSPTPLVALSGAEAAARKAAAAQAAVQLGLALFELPARLLPVDPRELEQLLRLWEREALLSGCALLVDWLDLEPAAPQYAALAQWVERAQGLITLSGRTRWPVAARRVVNLELPALTRAEQRAAWEEALGASAGALNGHLAQITSQFNLSMPAIQAAASAFTSAGDDAGQLWQACREQARPRLDDLAQRIQSPADWSHLVLPPLQESLLRQVVAHVRFRDKVFDDFGFAARSPRGQGISAVFAGPSGTGKTLAAEVLANHLQLDLYRIDLSAVVSKYIGETEKNLRRLFDAAEDGGAILFFDEADALFGKRSEVKDSHDRYANIEVAYLLQRMEAYRGLSILATNLPDALDTAFLRRIRFVIHFPFPAAEQRAQIWRCIFPDATPLADLDYTRLAGLDVAGGSIYSIALQAAFLAAEADSPVNMRHLMLAARGEFMRLEKPFPQDAARLIEQGEKTL